MENDRVRQAKQSFRNDETGLHLTHKQKVQRLYDAHRAQFPVGSVVEWHNTLGDRYRGVVAPPDKIRLEPTWGWRANHQLVIEIIGRTLNPKRKDAYEIGNQQPVEPEYLRRIDIPSEANKTRKRTLLQEFATLPEMGAFPGGINFQEAKGRFLHETAKTKSRKRNRRQNVR